MWRPASWAEEFGFPPIGSVEPWKVLEEEKNLTVLAVLAWTQ